MTPNEIFDSISRERAFAIFSFFQESEKPLYKATIESLAKQRKLRPVFLERKPRSERHEWMLEALGRRSNEALAAQLLQIWLVSQQTKLLCDFLDSLGITHDENGTVESIPADPGREALEKAIDLLLANHEAEVVAIYLNAFQALDENGWPALQSILDSDPRLQISQPVK
jgi:hypothetical protein